jgi:acetyltransferase
MGKLVSVRKKPIVVHSLFNSAKPHPLELLRYYGIPVYDSLEIAAKCTAVLAHYGSYLKKTPSKGSFAMNWKSRRKAAGGKIIETARAEKRRSLLEHEAKELLKIQGAPVTADRLAQTADEAVKIAKEVAGEVVLKIVSPDILHKSDAGGVRTRLKKEADIRKAFKEILDNARRFDPRADIRGVLVSPMAKGGIEVIIGTKYDDQFGPVIMYGLGGIMVEVLKDVAFRVLPLTSAEARKLIAETKSHPILDGARGTSPADKKALQKLLVLCSELVESYPEIDEMDLNPVIVHEKGLSIVDARIILKD